MKQFMEKYMNRNIFREYDIRGIVSLDLTDDVVYDLGRAFGTFLLKNNSINMSVSGDIRHTTMNLKKHFINGVLSMGIDVYDMGVLPTPANYFSLFTTEIENSVQITGSHNPSEYNGFKFSYNKKPFYGKSIQILRNIIEKKMYSEKSIRGSLYKTHVLNNYMNYLIDNFQFNKKLTVSVDCGNASACLVAPYIYDKLNLKVHKIYCDVNPDFPNHHPDPTVDSNLNDLIDNVIVNNSDLGIAFDGDADRIVVVDNKGKIIRSDILLSLFVPYVINEGDTVVYDVKCSNSLKETILKFRGVPIMCATGHSIVKNKIYENNSKLGGEMSGHIFFSDKFFGFDDALYVSLRLLDILSSSNIKLSDMVNSIPVYSSTPEIRLDCKDDDEKNTIVGKIKKYFIENYECETIDGVRVIFENGWALIRSSNTQPAIVLRLEANNELFLENYKTIILDKLNEFSGYNVSI